MENPMTAGREGADAVFLELDNMSWFLDGAKHRMPSPAHVNNLQAELVLYAPRSRLLGILFCFLTS